MPELKKQKGKSTLTSPSGQLDQAAAWLLENAENMAGHPRSREDSGSSSHSAPLSGVEVKAESVCICFIDDCLDCDIPLAELTFSSKHRYTRCVEGAEEEGTSCLQLLCRHGDLCLSRAGLYVLQRIGSTQEGNASFSLSGDYYNRELSGTLTHIRRSSFMHPLGD